VDKETLKQVFTAFAERGLPKVQPRALTLPLDSPRAVVSVGIRRSGKTCLLFDTMQRLVATGTDRRCLVHVNFEDDRLFPVRLTELDLILQAHAELYPDLAGQRRYLFLDEVQNVPGWEKFVRRVLDTEDARVFLTGSSSHLLTREVATAMRGRTLAYEVFPLSFAEFLAFRGIVPRAHSRASAAQCAAALREYLATGGFPEVVLAEGEVRPRLLKEYADLVLYKDLMERFNLDNPHLLKLLLKYCLTRPGTFLSVHKLYQDFRSQGLAVSKDTLYAYLDHLRESWVLFMLPKHDSSLRRQAVKPKKVFAVDPALAHPFAPEPLLDRGRKLENLVFLHWRRQREDLFYVADGYEVDLAVGEARCEALINVAYSLTAPEVFKRETDGLAKALRVCSGASATVVAEETTQAPPPPGIQVVPAWKYLLHPPA